MKLAAAIAAVATLLAAPLSAQIQGGLDSTPPTVSISPATSGLSVDSVRVTVTWDDNAGLDPATASITLGGVELAGILNGPFTYSGTTTHATSVGTVRLNTGANVLTAQIADAAGNLSTAMSVTYTHTAPPPPPPPPPVYTDSVQVTPKGGTDTLRVTTGGFWTATAFTVTNVGSRAASFVTSGACTGVAGGACTPTRDTVALAMGESRQVGVQFAVGGTVGTVGNVRLKVWMVGNAAVADSGWVPAKVVDAGSLAAPQTRPMLDRGDCPVISLGGGGASECGDLRLVHAFPSTRTLNRSHAPVLLYSSQHAYPSTVLSTLVTNGTVAAWDSVGVEVRRAGVVIATGRWPGWTDATTRRIAVPFAETGLSSTTPSATVYADTLVVKVKIAGTWQQQAPAPMRHIVVDRRGSPFGSGWWMAGLERLELSQGNNQLLWVGGDGGAAVYDSVAAGRWASAEPEGPDSILRQGIAVFNSAGTEPGYVRILPGKGLVAYNAAGLHRYTRNRLGQTTWFFYDGSNRLTQVAMPTAVNGDTTRSYYFRYTSAAGTLGEVVAPHVDVVGDRRTVLTATGTAGAVRVTQITDFPGAAVSVTSTTQYAYDAVGRDTMVIAPGTLTPTRFQYNTVASRVTRGMTIAQSNGQTDTISVGVTPQDLRGLAAANGSAPAMSSSFNTQVDGPLPGSSDFALYYQDANGRLTTVSTPLGATSIYRTDPRFPALVTRTKAPNGHNVFATYDTRGHLASQVDLNPLDDGRNAVSFYTWNDQWDEIASVTSPTGITTTFSYDSRGLREWQQVGTDTLRRTRYTYNAQGQVRSVRSVTATMPETIAYDSAGTGNLVSVTSPLGIQSVTLNDRIGRPVRVVMPVDTLRTDLGNGGLLFTRDSTIYDVAGHVLEKFTWGQQQRYFLKMDNQWGRSREDTLRVRNSYDSAGRQYKVERWSVPDSTHVGTVTTRFEYDGFSRKTAEIAPDSARDRYFYDLGSRNTLAINRRGDSIRTSYDILGHVRTRAMAGDSSTFTYDPATGAMLSADNVIARIRRSYYTNGLLKGDTSWLSRIDSTFQNGRHVYGLRYDYDLEGRRVALTLPDSVRPSSSQNQIHYAYDAATGALSQITDPLGYAYTFRYRADGAIDTLTAPGGVVETHEYDADGRLTVRTRGDASHPVLYRDSLRYDLRGKTVFASALEGTSEMTYDGLGHLVHSFTNEWSSAKVPESEEEYDYDALGNKAWHRRTSYAMQVVSTSPVHPTFEYYAPRTGRDTSSAGAPGIYLGAGVPPAQSLARRFDAAGNLYQMQELNPVQLLYGAASSGGGGDRRTSYAEPDGTSLVTRSSQDGQQQVFTNYTYRPDGKLTMVVRSSTCVYNNSGPIGGCTTQQPAYDKQGRTEEFRYDALGRRVWVTTVTVPDPNAVLGGCSYRCDNTTRRTVWDGDQVLAEIRYLNTQPEQDTGLDSANVAAAALAGGTTPSGNPYGGRNTSDWAQHGRMLYIHGGGMDQPLGMIRMDYSFDFPDPVVIVPHASWRGTYETASFVAASCKSVYLPSYEVAQQDSTGHRIVSPVVDENGNEYDVMQQRCVEIDFPGKYQGMTRFLRRQTASGPVSWMGSLMQDGQDASGLMFRRNRYYDPASGRFTQEDPIGLAGGLNSYGFAGGDPVGYSDPYGLCPPEDLHLLDCPPGFFTTIGASIGGTIGGIGGGISGGGTGAALCTPSGPGAFVCGGAGAAAGAAVGTARGIWLGGRIGAVLDGVILAKRQADAVADATSLVPNILGHLQKLGRDPDGDDSNHWRGEIRGWLNQIEQEIRHMGRRTASEWRQFVNEARQQLDRLSPD